MISFGLDRIIQQIKTKPASMSDKDVVEDVETLEEVSSLKRFTHFQALDKVKDELSSFDVYHSEVHGRNLEWSSPTHKSEKFWMENCLKIEESNLLEILKGSSFWSMIYFQIFWRMDKIMMCFALLVGILESSLDSILKARGTTRHCQI